MGVQLYLLDRRQASLVIDGKRFQIGTLRRTWKLTEIDAARSADHAVLQESLHGTNLPFAAMVADVVERSLHGAPHNTIASHIVIGWDVQRYSVTDLEWDFLPILGFAVRAPGTSDFVLYEEFEGGLIPMTVERAMKTAVLDRAGCLYRRSPPAIIECIAVKPLIETHVIANCRLADGRVAELVTELQDGHLPPPDWYKGKLPNQTRYFNRDGCLGS